MTDSYAFDRDCGGELRTDQVIARLAAGQHGVVSRQQLLTRGIGGDAVDHRLRRERLHVVFRGTYAVGHQAVRREAWWMAAVLSCGKGAVLSHRDGAALWDLRARDSGRIDVRSREARTSAKGSRSIRVVG